MAGRLFFFPEPTRVISSDTECIRKIYVRFSDPLTIEIQVKIGKVALN